MAKERDSPKQLLTLAEVMATLKIGRNGLYALFARGELSFTKVGGRRRVLLSELNRYIDRQTERVGR